MDYLKATRAIEDWIIDERRTLHQIPELAYGEHETGRHIQGVLQDLGIDFEAGLGGGTGIVAQLGSGSAPCVALRADMDALPIEEETGAAFASKNQGAMHACGHDSHMAMLLGAARVLKENEAQLQGPVKLIFQPAEEGGAGAKKLCEEGVLKSPDVARIFGLHVWPQLPTGTVGLRDGAFLASAGFFEIRIQGKGGHAAMPSLAIDPVVAAAAVVTALQTIVSRERDPFSSNVVSVTQMEAGNAYNVIPSEVRLAGTLRSLSLEDQEANAQRIIEITKGTAAVYRCEAVVEFPGTIYPPTVNHKDALAIGRRVATEIVGADALIEVPQTMGGEDFSFYAQEVPGCFCALGIGNDAKDTSYSLHHPRFAVDEDALAIGAAMHVAFACA